MKQNFVLNSVASFRDINASSLNRSKTKQTFSFSKNGRFEDYKPVCNQVSYGGDFIQHKTQGTGIGYGKRSDFTTCKTVSPAVTKYHFTNEFERNKAKGRGKSIGLSRDTVVFNQYVPKEAKKVPSANLYNNEKIMREKAPSYSMRSKTKVLDRSMTLDPERENPGPGSYQDLKSKTFASKFAEITYGTGRSKRFSSSNNGIPGAGSYNNVEGISGKGKYQNSKHLGGTQAIFSRTPRKSFFDRNGKSSLGPGSYRQPSEFGQYDGNVYGETMGRFSRRN